MLPCKVTSEYVFMHKRRTERITINGMNRSRMQHHGHHVGGIKHAKVPAIWRREERRLIRWAREDVQWSIHAEWCLATHRPQRHSKAAVVGPTLKTLQNQVWSLLVHFRRVSAILSTMLGESVQFRRYRLQSRQAPHGQAGTLRAHRPHEAL